MKINLKKIRKNKNISQLVLADMIGTKQNYISEIESGKKTPSLKMLKRIADALNVCPGFLLDENVDCDNCKKCICTGGTDDVF